MKKYKYSGRTIAQFEDIKTRHDLALAERNCTQPGSENYNTLSEVARRILDEYASVGKPKSQRVRNGFRLYGGKYHPVILADCNNTPGGGASYRSRKEEK